MEEQEYRTRLIEAGTRRYGRLASRPQSVNPLDEFGGLSRPLRRLRLKEWVGFTLIHPDWAASMILQDANYLASSEIYVAERATGTLHQHAANARGGSLRLPATLLGSSPAFRKPGYLLAYEFSADGKPHRIRADIAATAKAPALAAELELHGEPASAPLSVSHKMPGGKLYTHKALFPVAGTLRVGDSVIEFDPSRDLAIIDEHKSFLPYRTNWLWGTFGFQGPTGPTGPTGANFCARPSLPGEESENCLWVPGSPAAADREGGEAPPGRPGTPAGGACEPLAEITFTAESADPLARWTMRSADGRLDVEFTPDGRKDVRHQLGLFEIDYFQLYGTYRGTLRALDGTTHQIETAPGVCESMKARL